MTEFLVPNTNKKSVKYNSYSITEKNLNHQKQAPIYTAINQKYNQINQRQVSKRTKHNSN